MNVPSPAASVPFRQRLAYSVPQAADAVSVSARTMNRWIEQGRIRAKKIGGRVIVPHAELERFLAMDSAAA